MKIALIGYGNMGQEVEALAKSQGHLIVSISFRDRNAGLDKEGIKKADVVIDFSSPQIIISNIKTVLELRKPMVIGTTGWYEDIKKVKKLVSRYKGSVIYGQNFSIGANIFFSIVSFASSLLSKYKDYDVFGIETHHTGKKDSPSGTARKLSEIIMQNFKSKTKLQLERLDRAIEKDELHFVSVRGGRNFGRHEIVFDSSSDEIRLTHQAWGRRGFAQGALEAANFIVLHKGFYNFSDVLNEKTGVRKK
ncbi:MAG: 4-hydroxy-tetrahydrodipicolinate reductase [Candidatus Levybacteria bacterium]|nr:4-hydroxy-tetrahydrodipicolinate reductase [Candidatus Levybacteria bacterium]